MNARVDPRTAYTRATVLEAVAEILAESGFERLTMEAVADRSGVARSTIYRNWPDRVDLLIEGFELLCAFSAPDHGVDLRTDLSEFGRELARGLSDERWGHALPSLIGAVAHDPDLRRAQESFSARRRDMLASVFERALARGEIDTARYSTSALAELFASGFFFRALVSGQALDEAFVQHQVQLVLTLAGEVQSGRAAN